MKQYVAIGAVITFALFSCNKKSNSVFSSLLNRNNLPAQIFTIDITRDTVLLTKKGVVISIPKGSIESEKNILNLEIKEALTNTDIVLAGLTTMSGGKALSSGGMMYIDLANDDAAKITKQLTVYIPTKDYNPEMSIFKGIEKNDGTIDWIDPEPLPNDSLQLLIKSGQELFTANCNNCHKISEDFTGPSLKGITRRIPLSWIYEFTKNPSGRIRNEPYFRRLFDYWQPTIMTAFPALSNKDIYNILAYVETKGGMKGTDFRKLIDSQGPCVDSCEKYLKALNAIDELRMDIEETNEDFFDLKMSIPIPPVKRNSLVSDTGNSIFNVEEKSAAKGMFYTINIKTFGWVNVDIMEEQNKTESSRLAVKVDGDLETETQVMLIIPSAKLFVKGRKSPDSNQYIFYKEDGSIPLPQSAPCYIIAFAESQGKLVFGKQLFISNTNQTIHISLSEILKDGFTEQIKALKLDGIEANIPDSKQVKEKILEKNISEAEKLKPVNCDCGISPFPTADPVKNIPVAKTLSSANGYYSNIFVDGDSLNE